MVTPTAHVAENQMRCQCDVLSPARSMREMLVHWQLLVKTRLKRGLFFSAVFECSRKEMLDFKYDCSTGLCILRDVNYLARLEGAPQAGYECGPTQNRKFT